MIFVLWWQIRDFLETWNSACALRVPRSCFKKFKSSTGWKSVHQLSDICGRGDSSVCPRPSRPQQTRQEDSALLLHADFRTGSCRHYIHWERTGTIQESIWKITFQHRINKTCRSNRDKFITEYRMETASHFIYKDCSQIQIWLIKISTLKREGRES